MAEIPGKSLGQVAYEGYSGRSGGVSLISGDQLPGWEDQHPAVQDAWEAAAEAVVSAGRGEDTELR